MPPLHLTSVYKRACYLKSTAAEQSCGDGGEPVVVEQQAADGRQDAVDGRDLVVGRVEQLERRQGRQLHRHVRQTVVRQQQRVQAGEPSKRRRHLQTTLRYDTRCYFNVSSQADMSQLNLPHGTDN